MKTRVMVVMGLVCVGLSAAGGVYAQGGKPTVQSADITSDKWTYNWKTKTFTFTGNCRVEVKGPDHAVMTAPNMTGKASGSGNQITEIVASGPVQFDITTAKDEKGVQQIINAACAGQAVYRGGDKKVTLAGGAEAVMATNPADPNVEPARMTATTLTISLVDFEIGGDGLHIDMQFAPQDVKKGP